MIMITFTRSLTLFNIHFKASTFLLFTRNIQIKWCPIISTPSKIKWSARERGFWKNQNGDIQLSNTVFKLENCSKIAEWTLLKRSVWFQQNMKIKLWKYMTIFAVWPFPERSRTIWSISHKLLTLTSFWRNLVIQKSIKVTLGDVDEQALTFNLFLLLFLMTSLNALF